MDVPATGQRSNASREVDRSSGDHNRFLASVVLVAALGLWIPQLTSSLWADETVTHWIIKDGMSQTLERATEFEGESPLYFLILEVWERIFGSSEIALRIPSLLAVGGAAVLLWRLGKRLADTETGLLAALVFAASPGMTFAAGDARPYPIAVFGLVAATFLLVRWADTGSGRDALGYVALTVLTLYFHYFAVTALVVHPLYVWLRRDRIELRRYGMMLLGVAALMIPAIPHIASLMDRRETLQIAISVSATDYFEVLVPPLLVGSIALGLVAARRSGRLGVEAPYISPGGPALCLGWWIVPTTLLYLVTQVSSTTLFEPRFFFFALPGLALTAGLATRIVEPSKARRVVAVAVAIAAFWGFSSVTHSGDNWREAAAAERRLAAADTPVLFRPNFIEAAQIDWLSRPGKREYLLSELSPYPMRGDIVPIPYDLTPSAKVYLERVIEGKLAGVRRFLLVNDRGVFRIWLEGRLPSFATRTVGNGGLVTIVVFESRSG